MGEVSFIRIRTEKVADSSYSRLHWIRSDDAQRPDSKSTHISDQWRRGRISMIGRGRGRMDCASIIYDVKAEFIPRSESHVLRWRLT